MCKITALESPIENYSHINYIKRNYTYIKKKSSPKEKKGDKKKKKIQIQIQIQIQQIFI